MTYICFKRKDEISKPYAIGEDYFFDSYTNSNGVTDFSIYSTGSDIKLKTVDFSSEELNNIKQNGLITNDMQEFYKSSPEFLEELKHGIAFNWENGVLVYNSEFKQYEGWVDCRKLKDAIGKLAHYFEINTAQVPEFKRSSMCCYKIIGATNLIYEMHGNIEVALLNGE